MSREKKERDEKRKEGKRGKIQLGKECLQQQSSTQSTDGGDLAHVSQRGARKKDEFAVLRVELCMKVILGPREPRLNIKGPSSSSLGGRSAGSIHNRIIPRATRMFYNTIGNNNDDGNAGGRMSPRAHSKDREGVFRGAENFSAIAGNLPSTTALIEGPYTGLLLGTVGVFGGNAYYAQWRLL